MTLHITLHLAYINIKEIQGGDKGNYYKRFPFDRPQVKGNLFDNYFNEVKVQIEKLIVYSDCIINEYICM